MESIVFLMIVLFVFAVLLWKGYEENKRKDRKTEKELQAQWKERREKIFSPYDMEQISYFSRREKTKSYVDDLTWDNLEMDRVYEKICYCSSTLGEEYFYHMLRNPIRDWEELKKLEKKITCFLGTKETILLQKKFLKLGRIKKYSMFQYLDYLMKQETGSNTIHYLGLCFLAVSFLFLYFNVFLGIFLLFVGILFQLMTYFKVKAGIEPCLLSLRYMYKVLTMGKTCLSLMPEEWEEERNELLSLLHELKGMKSFSLLAYGALGGMEFLVDYIRMIFHTDIIRYHKILEEVKKKERKLINLYMLLGKLESCLSIAQYRNTLEYWTIPMEASAGKIRIEEGYHPLLEKPVANNLFLSGPLLLTGSNASGKSTFLKMLGISILLSQAIHTSPARKLSFPSCKVMACLAVRDSLLFSESYYVAEIKAVKHILEEAEKGEAVVCMVDELLRGTNTMERIAAASEILLEMHNQSILVLAATHDRELTNILDDIFENYHFEEAVIGQELHFSYKLLPGRADTTNAISLLGYMGYHADLIERARKRLEKFQKEGEWK